MAQRYRTSTMRLAVRPHSSEEMHDSTTADPEKPSVDVCVPTLGNAPYLTEAIESVFAQTLSSWRLVVFENGPASEEVHRILAPYRKDRRVHHRVIGETITMSANWTRAIQDGNAPHVAILHDDDRWDPEFLSRRVRFLESNPQCGFVFGGYKVINEAGDAIRSVQPDFPSGSSHSAVALPILYETCLVCPPTPLVRREAYDAVGAEFKEVFLTDHEMWIRLAAQFDVGYLQVCDSEYRFHPTQTTAKKRLEIGRGHLEVIGATGHLSIPTTVRRRTHANAHLLSAIDSVELGRRRETLSHLQSAIRTQPVLLVTPGSVARVLLVLLALVVGDRGRRVLAALRVRRFLKRTGTNRAGVEHLVTR